jgi:YD repeat-containing protein
MYTDHQHELTMPSPGVPGTAKLPPVHIFHVGLVMGTVFDCSKISDVRLAIQYRYEWDIFGRVVKKNQTSRQRTGFASVSTVQEVR